MIDTYGEGRMASLFPVLQRTLDIDLALLEVYGLDQFGLDSAWRTFKGLEPLPSPDELETQLGDASESTASEDPSPEGLGDAPDSDAGTSSPGSTPEAEDQVTGVAGGGDEEPEGDSNSPGCSVAASGSGGAPIGIGMLLLLGSPLGLVALPRLRRRWPFR